MEEDCLITMFSENKRFSSFFSNRPIKFKVTIEDRLNLPDLSGNSTQIMNVVGPFAQKKTCECFVIRKCCDWTIFF